MRLSLNHGGSTRNGRRARTVRKAARQSRPLVVTDSMHTRKAAMADHAAGFVALPGGYGTLDEALEILTWNQIGTIAKPVAFLDVNGYFGSLFRFFDDAVASGLIRPEHRAMAQRAETVSGAIAIATGPPPSSPSKWTDPSIR